MVLESKLMIFSEFFRRELGDTIYLFSVSVAVWIITGKDKKQCLKHQRTAIGTGRWKKGIPVMAVLASFFVIFYQHPRVSEILSGLSNPIQSVEGGIYDINWFGYRIALLFRGWAEDLSMMKYEHAMFTIEQCPLLCIKYAGGMMTVVFVLVLESLLLYCLILEFRKDGETEDRTLRKVLLAALVIHSILGLFAELFLITSTDVGLLLLRNPGDVIIILYLLQSKRVPIKFQGGNENV